MKADFGREADYFTKTASLLVVGNLLLWYPACHENRYVTLHDITDMEVSTNGGVQNGWFTRENPTKIDDDWGYPYDSGNPYF